MGTIPTITRWVVIVVLLALGVGGISGFSSYRRYAELDQRLSRDNLTIHERNGRIVSLTEALAAMQVQLELSGSMLRASRQALSATERLLRDAAEEARTAREIVSGQQQRIDVLRTCLAGTAQAMNYMAAGDQHGAMRVMVAVDRECSQAETLLTLD